MTETVNPENEIKRLKSRELGGEIINQVLRVHRAPPDVAVMALRVAISFIIFRVSKESSEAEHMAKEIGDMLLLAAKEDAPEIDKRASPTPDK